MEHHRARRLILPLSLTVVSLASSIGEAEDRFVDGVAPVLAQRCLSCHNEETAKGGLSLQNAAILLEEGHVEAGDADASPLMELITPVDGQAAMPKDADPLSPPQLAAIREWIDEGADIPRHFRLEPPLVADRNWWSLQPIPPAERPLSPAVVDEFVDAKLNEHGLTPLPEAEPGVLIRRVTYDLSGLPPTPHQIDAFVTAWEHDALHAWTQLVDRLLAAPEFGEKWGQHWLDLARYAETHGYDKDKPRPHAWPYRDYVIRCFNGDKPVGEFVREQIAGDVLAKNPSEGIVATGFLAAGPWDFIAHVEVGEEKMDGRIAKHLDRDEMLAAVFNVFQSTTIQCAQCHNHKFDPVTSEDYYRAQAVFAAVDRAPRIYRGRSEEQNEHAKRLQREVERLQARREQAVAERQATIDEKTRDLTQRMQQLNFDLPIDVPSQHGFHSQIEKEASQTKWLQVDLGQPQRLQAIELIASFDRFNDIGEGFGFPVRLRVEVSGDNPVESDRVRWKTLLEAASHDYPNPGAVPVRLPTGREPIRLIRVTATKLAERREDFIFALGEIRAIASANAANVALDADVQVSDTIPANQRWSPRFVVDGRFYGDGIPADRLAQRAELIRQRDAIVQSIPMPPQIAEIDSRIAELQRQMAAIPPGQLVYTAATDFSKQGKFEPTLGKVRSIHVLNRGDLSSPGERALPGAPKLWQDAPHRFVQQDDYQESEARAALAAYVTHQNNPLLWRSMANRIWQWTFGKPIVDTPNDFGRMGRRPTHPELLDFLAASLRDDPEQSLKSVLRALLLSRAYRRASHAIRAPQASAASGTEDLHETNRAIDASNDLLWRANRRRLTAEEFRDTVLAVSGALRIEQRGGPSFRDFVIEHPEHSPHYQYHLHDAEDVRTHRRTIYRFVVRSQPQPMLTTLDCADPSISVARRDESTTALQVLTQWNNRLVEAMSRRFAQRIETKQTIDEQVRLATRLAWGRSPTETEYDVLRRLNRQQGPETLCRVVLNASAMNYLD